MASARHFRVIKDTPLWKQGAIISNGADRSEYHAVLNLWDNTNLDGEYLSNHIVEKQPDWFEEVEPSLGKNAELTFTRIKDTKK